MLRLKIGMNLKEKLKRGRKNEARRFFNDFINHLNFMFN